MDTNTDAAAGTKPRKNPKNLRLSDEGDRLLTVLSGRLGVTQVSIIEMALRRMARAEGVEVQESA